MFQETGVSDYVVVLVLVKIVQTISNAMEHKDFESFGFKKFCASFSVYLLDPKLINTIFNS